MRKQAQQMPRTDNGLGDMSPAHPALNAPRRLENAPKRTTPCPREVPAAQAE